jgi:ketosteroid isomerase-like protein
MEDHPNAAIFRRYFERGPAEAAEAIADDVEWWEIGRNQPTIGKEALMERMAEQAGQWEIDGQLHDVVANDEHVIALINASAKRDDRTLDYRVAEVYHMREGKVTQRWAFSDDTAAIAEFFS